MNATALAAQVSANPRAVVLVGAALGAWLLILRLRSRYLRARLSRAVARSFSPDRPGRRPGARSQRRMVARAASSRRASRRLRKAALISALIAAAWLFTELHTHTR